MNDSNTDENIRAIQQLTHILAKWESKLYRNKLDNIILYLSMKIWKYFFKRWKNITCCYNWCCLAKQDFPSFFFKFLSKDDCDLVRVILQFDIFIANECLLTYKLHKKTNYKDKLKNKCTHWYTLFDTLASRYLTA